jgi:hypothetical protein
MMTLHLDVVCDGPALTVPEKSDKAARVIGELLPFVLAKYGVGSSSSQAKRAQHKTAVRPQTAPRFSWDERGWDR